MSTAKSPDDRAYRTVAGSVPPRYRPCVEGLESSPWSTGLDLPAQFETPMARVDRLARDLASHGLHVTDHACQTEHSLSGQFDSLPGLAWSENRFRNQHAAPIVPEGRAGLSIRLCILVAQRLEPLATGIQSSSRLATPASSLSRSVGGHPPDPAPVLATCQTGHQTEPLHSAPTRRIGMPSPSARNG